MLPRQQHRQFAVASFVSWPSPDVIVSVAFMIAMLGETGHAHPPLKQTSITDCGGQSSGQIVRIKLTFLRCCRIDDCQGRRTSRGYTRVPILPIPIAFRIDWSRIASLLISQKVVG
jgi:hypothetical protein